MNWSPRSVSRRELEEMTMTSSEWCDTVIKDKVWQVNFLCCEEVSQQETCRTLLRYHIVNKLDLCSSDGCAFHEFLSGIARCAGYKPLQNNFQK